MSTEAVLEWWLEANARLRAVYAATDPSTRVPWYGLPMSARSKITARIMETWAHGVDVRDALGITDIPLVNLRHVCHLAVRARPYAFQVHGMKTPAAEPYVELRHGDDVWVWGHPNAADRVLGSALGFALVATQRRHRLDTNLVAVGADAERWLDIAQAFAGPPGSGRRPLER